MQKFYRQKQYECFYFGVKSEAIEQHKYGKGGVEINEVSGEI